jgi:hypothetical protein
MRVKKPNGVHPKNDHSCRALYFDQNGNRITMAEHTKPKPIICTVGEMARHLAAVADWLNESA